MYDFLQTILKEDKNPFSSYIINLTSTLLFSFVELIW